jgi:hypothetical protein
MSKLKATPPPKPKAAALPHSWLASEWPANVAPNRQGAAKHLIRTHRQELIACGALCRIGRSVTVLGAGYAVFLAKRMGTPVTDFLIAPNAQRKAT